MAEIEACFTHLHENVPSWFVELDGAEENIKRMRAEIANMPAQRPATLKRRTGSVESIRDLDAIFAEPSSSRPHKPSSIYSALAPGRAKYRSRALMVSVHYDGQLQKQFEVLVRGIGTARNLLRKGKMAAKAQELAELAGSEDDEESDDDIQNHIRAKIEFRRRTGLSTMRAPQTMRTSEPPSTDVRPPESLFNSTDKLLEQTQVFCERAAHRVLREGECQKELASMRTNFQEVLEIATREAAKHRAHRKDNELKRKSAEVLKELAVVTVVTHEAKPAAPVIRSIQPMSTTNGLEIEIDDDDGDDNFVLPPIRLTSRA